MNDCPGLPCLSFSSARKVYARYTWAQSSSRPKMKNIRYLRRQLEDLLSRCAFITTMALLLEKSLSANKNKKRDAPSSSSRSARTHQSRSQGHRHRWQVDRDSEREEKIKRRRLTHSGKCSSALAGWLPHCDRSSSADCMHIHKRCRAACVRPVDKISHVVNCYPPREVE